MGGALKSQSLAVSNRLGVTRLVGQSSWRRRRLLILCYHGISLGDEHEWNPGLYMPARNFESRLETLRRSGCTILPLGDAIARLYGGDLPERAVAITFDDGYYDFLRRAHPLLERFGYPVTVYLPTLRCEHNFPIVNVLVSYMLWMRRTSVLKAPDVPGLGNEDYPLATSAQRTLVLNRINKVIVPLDPEPAERDDVSRAVARALGLDYDRFVSERVLTLMRPAEVAELASRGVDFQLHTHRHRSPADDQRFVAEILENRQRIEAMTGRPAVHFCYPSGVYRLSHLPLLTAHGVVSATTTNSGIADPASNPLLLPRFVDTSAVTNAEFEAWLHGIMPWLQRTRTTGADQRLAV
jgi:peptidoglycan/xylan/chitin deacetylase (PgdA/CDA1 family)